MHKIKKFLILLLSVVILFSSSIMAFADENTNTGSGSADNVTNRDSYWKQGAIGLRISVVNKTN